MNILKLVLLLCALVAAIERGAHADSTRSRSSSDHGIHRQVQQMIHVPISIQEGVGASSFATSGYPTAVVVPFAKGAIFDETSLSILEGNPCQVVVLERWLSDNSIRHAQVHFQVHLTANTPLTLHLINTGPSPKPIPTQPVSVLNDATFVLVDTGRVKFRISKISFNLIDQLWFDQNGNSVYEANELMIVSNHDHGGRLVPRSGAGSTQKDSARSDFTVEVEESGPLRAVIKVSANTIFQSTTDHVHGFAVRFYAYAGQPHVKVDYQLQNSAGNAVRSWPLYFEEMTVDWSFQLPNTTAPKVSLGSTTRDLYNASSTPCRLLQYRPNFYQVEEFFDLVFEERNVPYSRVSKNAAFVHLQSATTGVTVAVRNFWQASPNGLGMVGDSKVSVELFPSWSAQFTTSGPSSTGLYWLNDMQHVYKEFLISFHSSAPSANQLFDLASTFQFPPVASVPPSWYRSTKASLDLGGYLPDTITAPSFPDTFSPDVYWDSLSLNASSAFFKGDWVNFGDVQGPSLSSPCTTMGGYPYDVEFYAATQYAAHYYVAETWGLGEANVRPQSLPSYNYLADYDRLRLTQAGNCSGSWRIFGGNGVSKLAAPLLSGSENVLPTYGARDDQHGWFYHVEQSYFYTGSYWLKDWYKFVGQFRRGFLLLKQLSQDGNSGSIAHALGHTQQSIRITGDSVLIADFANYFRGFLRPRQDQQYGSEFNITNGIQKGYQTGFLMRTIINYMDLVRDVDVQLYAELFNYLSGMLERNLNIGNFAELHDQYTGTGKGRSNSNSLSMIAPQAWYYWHTGKIQFWNQVQDYMNGTLGDRPSGAPWTTFPDPNGFDNYGRRLYIYVLQNNRQDVTPPPAISDLSVTLSSGQATLQWTGPATAVRYHAVWSDKPIVEIYSLSTTVSNWWAARAIGVSGVAKPGLQETLLISLPGIQIGFFVAIFSFDQNNNMSVMSNVAAVVGPSVPLSPSAPVPQVAPVPPPVTLPQDSPVSRPILVSPTEAPFERNGFVCFSDHNTVQIFRRHDAANLTIASSEVLRTIPMSQLAIGDYVTTAQSGDFTRVISFCHRNEHAIAPYIQIHRSPWSNGPPNATTHPLEYPALEMSAVHLVSVRRGDNVAAAATWVRAADVHVGDLLLGAAGPQVVTQIARIERRGLYAPITESGTLLVSSVLVSSYVAVFQTQKSVPLFPTDWQHSMGHVILTPVRLLCRYDFGRYCASERYNLQGYTWYSELIMHFADWINWTGAQETFWTKLWMATIRWLATVGITLPFSLLYGMECLLFGNGVVGMEKTGRGGEWNDEGKGWMTAAVTIVLTVYIFHRRSQSVK
jgi:Hint module/YetA-like protein